VSDFLWLVFWKGKEEYLYSTFYNTMYISKRSDVDNTVLPANYTMPAFPL